MASIETRDDEPVLDGKRHDWNVMSEAVHTFKNLHSAEGFGTLRIVTRFGVDDSSFELSGVLRLENLGGLFFDCTPVLRFRTFPVACGFSGLAARKTLIGP